MSRILTCLTVLLAAVAPLAAQVRRQGEPIPLTLHPAALPEPSLKYRLLPDRAELVPGNAATIYYRSEAMFVENRYLLDDIQEDHWDRWFITPIKDLPQSEVEAKLGPARNFLHEIEVATHYRRCDWEVDSRSEGVGLFTPDLRGFRRAALLLGVRARHDMARGHFPEALQSLQTGYALARHLGAGPSFNHVLVAEVAANLMNYQVEDLIQRPGAPNLYWSLAVLPRPYFDIGPAVEDEGTVLERTWPWLKRLEEGPMSGDEVRAAREKVRKTLERYNITPPDAEKAVQEAYPEAKRALLAQGVSVKEADAMPPFQVVALDAARQYRRSWQEYTKWFQLPGGWREPGYRKAAERYRGAVTRLDRLFFGGLIHALGIGDPDTLNKVYTSMDQIERNIAALRCLEALRLYAAGHGGKLPAALSDITEVPVPPDPITGKPFTYEAHGDHARLSAAAPTDEPPPALQKLVYDVTLRP